MSIGIYFLGSGKIGIPVLKKLAEEPEIQILGIGSQPDRPVGRKKVLSPTALAVSAIADGYDVERIESVNDPVFLAHLRELKVELLVVVAFGQLLKKEILELPPFGCLNVHASVLPMYRGACPINSSILNGDRETGVTFMKMDKGLDTGPIYHIVKAAVLPDENTGQLETRLGELAGKEICQVCRGICRGGWQSRPQPATDAPNVHKISKNDGEITWSSNAERISNMVRAYTPWPKAYTYLDMQGNRRRLQITRAVKLTKEDVQTTLPEAVAPGEVVVSSTRELIIACGQDFLKIERLVPEGKKEMPAGDFLRGNPIAVGTILG